MEIIFLILFFVIAILIIYYRLFSRRNVRENYIAEGFQSVNTHPVAVTDHARVRLSERVGITSFSAMDRHVQTVYKLGKSKIQVGKASAGRIRDIEQRYGNGIVLIYKGFVYIFSRENVLITVYYDDNFS